MSLRDPRRAPQRSPTKSSLTILHELKRFSD
ncbi:hypothetical protein KPSA1_03242 [Pseudomonas syringae pv. actinidiae]|uniref:Uncharacterized protein n=1 Tax=Pseudomonas syringae pv. actinidiae TaxID=103796 RepID=A0A2V0QGW0_PSESF|nr:hypothetical protein KPSA1_03242 [Pseudomonas syringae pv. actinidiae]